MNQRELDVLDANLIDEKPETLWLLNRFIRQMQEDGKMMSVTGGKVWLFKMRVFAYPELLSLGKSMWEELQKGFDYVEQTAKDVEEGFGMAVKINGYRDVSKGFD